MTMLSQSLDESTRSNYGAGLLRFTQFWFVGDTWDEAHARVDHSTFGICSLGVLIHGWPVCIFGTYLTGRFGQAMRDVSRSVEDGARVCEETQAAPCNDWAYACFATRLGPYRFRRDHIRVRYRCLQWVQPALILSPNTFNPMKHAARTRFRRLRLPNWWCTFPEHWKIAPSLS
jgi:hypothetical protein